MTHDRLSRTLGRLRKRQAPAPELFKGDTRFLTTHGPGARLYGEYGCGQSTLWMAENTDARIVSVDSSQDWIASTRARVGDGRVTFHWIDIGPLRDWGMPESYAKRANFPSYPRALWSGPETPDLVLIDGRFRVACFLETLAHADPGTRIIFDDYVDRPRYHLIEEYLAPVERTRRQALFVVPDGLDREAAAAEAVRFQMVFN